MKKFKSYLLIICMVLFLTSCNSKKAVKKDEIKIEYQEVKVDAKTDLYQTKETLKIGLTNTYGNAIPYVAISDMLAYLDDEIKLNENISSEMSTTYDKGIFTLEFSEVDEETQEEFNYV
ncbi:MAG: hypothetical protein ACRCTA_06665, partial [Bacilli bacterium]